MAAPYILGENTWKTVRDQEIDIVILPWGATEAHNLHLPYGTDTLESEFIARMSARKAFEKGARLCVLPAIPFGINTSQLDIHMTINMNPSTMMKILEDVLDSLSMHGIRKFVIFNSHGGNEFKGLVRELQPRYPEIFIAVLNWYESIPLSEFFEAGGDHANEMETSIMMHIAPEFVLPLNEAGKGKAKKSIITARREGWVWFPRAWTQVTEDTGIGDPAKATADKGVRYLEAVTDKIAVFFRELAAASPDQMYS